jgi:hypothetical protein
MVTFHRRMQDCLCTDGARQPATVFRDAVYRTSVENSITHFTKILSDRTMDAIFR